MKIISEKKREASSRNLKLAQEALVTHSFYLNLTLSPDKWEPDMREMYQQRFNQLIKLDHIDVEKDAGMCAQVARIETILARLYKYLMQHEIVDSEGNTAPILSVLGSYENGLRRMYETLALTPSARKTLRLEAAPGLAIALSAIEAEHEDS